MGELFLISSEIIYTCFIIQEICYFSKKLHMLSYTWLQKEEKIDRYPDNFINLNSRLFSFKAGGLLILLSFTVFID